MCPRRVSENIINLNIQHTVTRNHIDFTALKVMKTIDYSLCIHKIQMLVVNGVTAAVCSFFASFGTLSFFFFF